MYSHEPLGDDFDDLLVNFVDAETALDEHDAAWFATGNLPVFFPDPLEKFALFQLEAVLVFSGLSDGALVTASCATKARMQRRKKQDSEVWPEIAADEAVQREDAFGSELTSAALVSLSGVGEAIAKDDPAGGQCGLDHLGNSLGAISEHQSHFGHWSKGRRSGVEQQGANAIAGCCSAGLSGDDRIEAASLHPCS